MGTLIVSVFALGLFIRSIGAGQGLYRRRIIIP
jgi:hypothetical protein